MNDSPFQQDTFDRHSDENNSINTDRVVNIYCGDNSVHDNEVVESSRNDSEPNNCCLQRQNSHNDSLGAGDPPNPSENIYSEIQGLIGGCRKLVSSYEKPFTRSEARRQLELNKLQNSNKNVGTNQKTAKIQSGDVESLDIVEDLATETMGLTRNVRDLVRQCSENLDICLNDTNDSSELRRPDHQSNGSVNIVILDANTRSASNHGSDNQFSGEILNITHDNAPNSGFGCRNAGETNVYPRLKIQNDEYEEGPSDIKKITFADLARSPVAEPSIVYDLSNAEQTDEREKCCCSTS